LAITYKKRIIVGLSSCKIRYAKQDQEIDYDNYGKGKRGHSNSDFRNVRIKKNSQRKNRIQ